MIAPFVPQQVKEVGGARIISYGLTSYGYDARAAAEWQVCREPRPANPHAPIDPLHFDPKAFEPYDYPALTLAPHGFALARTVERFIIPRDVLVLCVGKSTYARCGLVVNVTPLEPEWEGHVTLELSNTTPRPILIRADQGICQFVFFRASESCATSYRDKDGKYQDQHGITFPR
jgi:dCTP deaminase